MDAELAKEIEDAVLEVLNNSDMDSTTEFQVRKAAAELVGLDLSDPVRKTFVRNVVQKYLEEQQAKVDADEKATGEDEPEAVEEEDDSDDDNNKKKKGALEFDDEGDLIICRVCLFPNLLACFETLVLLLKHRCFQFCA